MKILLMITGLGIGGAERQVCALADQFYSMGHQVMLLCLNGTIAMSPTQKDIPLINLEMKKTLFGFLFAYIKSLRILYTFKPDIIHSHMFHANIFARLLKIVCVSTPLVCTAHNVNEGGKVRMLVYRITDFLASRSTNVSKEAVQRFIDMKASSTGRMVVMYNGVDDEKFYPSLQERQRTRDRFGIKENEHVIVCIGRLEPQKNYPMLLRTFTTVYQTHKNIYLWIVGDGFLHHELSAFAQELDISHRIRFLGVQHEINALLNAADIFTLASSFEGFPMVILEAMLCEKMIVATACGGIKEALDDSTFLAQEPFETHLSVCLNKALMLSDEQKAQYQQKARKRALSLFSLETIAHQWVRLYEDVKR